MTHTLSLRRMAHLQRGLSLIELMVAIAIGLFLMIGLVAVFANSNRTYVDLSRASHQIENGRFAIQLLTDDVSAAGFFGRYGLQLTVPGALPDPCTTAPATLKTGAAFAVQGYDAPAGDPSGWANPVTCLLDANHVDGTDVLVVRRADSQISASNPPVPAIPAGSLNALDVYLQANSDPNTALNPTIDIATATPDAVFTLTNKDAVNRAPVRKYHVHIYFVAPCSIPNGGGTTCTGASDDGGNPIPTLKRLELSVSGGALGMNVVSLVEGIENFQVDYGLDTDGDGGPNSYVTAPAAVADWANVVSVRTHVLARNLEPSGVADTKTYDLGAAGSVTPGGLFKRHVYNAVIRVVNPSSRREL